MEEDKIFPDCDELGVAGKLGLPGVRDLYCERGNGDCVVEVGSGRFKQGGKGESRFFVQESCAFCVVACARFSWIWECMAELSSK